MKKKLNDKQWRVFNQKVVDISGPMAFICYFTFLVLYVAMSVEGRGTDLIYFAGERALDRMCNRLVQSDAHSVRSVQDIHNYLTKEFHDSIYSPGASSIFFTEQMIMVGKVRIMTQRSGTGNCTKGPDFFHRGLQASLVCYDHDVNRKDVHQSYGGADCTRPGQDNCVYKYINNEKKNTTTVYHIMSFGTYEEGTGFATYLPNRNATELDSPLTVAKTAKAELEMLESNDFIDARTRVMFVDVNMYNTNLQVLFNVRFSAEFPLSGGIFSECSCYTMTKVLVSAR
jgi:hypothetical protein